MKLSSVISLLPVHSWGSFYLSGISLPVECKDCFQVELRSSMSLKTEAWLLEHISWKPAPLDSFLKQQRHKWRDINWLERSSSSVSSLNHDFSTTVLFYIMDACPAFFSFPQHFPFFLIVNLRSGSVLSINKQHFALMFSRDCREKWKHFKY